MLLFDRLAGAGFAAFEHFQHGVQDMLGGHGFDRIALQIMALRPAGHGLQVAGGAGVDGHGHFQPGFVQRLAMGGQQVLKNAAFERLHGGPKQGRVQLRQLQQNGVRAPLYGGRVGGGQGRGLGRGSSSGGISHGRAAKAAKKKPKPAMMPALGCLRG